MHTLKRAPTSQSLRNGTQTQGNLLSRESTNIRALSKEFANLIQVYLDSIDVPTDHRFLARRRAGIAFSASWSVCLQSDGFHVNHIHPKGWISSAFYIDLPKSIGESGKEGWFKAGESYLRLGGEDRDGLFIRPEPGVLVLFPSYMWHGTYPFHGDGNRLAIAFDTLPV
jgi:uncharacterized protein (TIGR02466 family)